MYQKIFLMLLALGLFGLMIGCSETTTSSPGNGQISDDFDGYTPTDEAPAFGDSYLAALGEDSVYVDSLEDDSDVIDVINDTDAGVYAVQIVWGRMQFDTTLDSADIAAIDPIDWAGSLEIDYGVMLLRRLIRFEPATDSILPRTDPKIIEWESQTTVHNDGIFVNLYIPPSVASVIQTITFKTKPFTYTFNIADLASMDTIFYLDDSVNAVAIRAHKLYFNACPKGFLEGYWGKDSTGQGVFGGRWISQFGTLAGYLKGTWGKMVVDSTGDTTILKVFYGKYIDVDGNFEGLIKGVYLPRPWHGHGIFANCPPHGRFFGRFYDANENVLGVLRGNYRMAPTDANSKMGYFGGRWKTYCPRFHNDEFDGMDDVDW
jgi:hypothetical protein